MVGTLAHEFRVNLFKEHLGITSNETIMIEGKKVNMEKLIRDPLEEKFREIFTKISQSNTEIFRRIFRCVNFLINILGS